MCSLLQIGATVGKAEYRVQAAQALIATVRCHAASSPEIMEMVLQASPEPLSVRTNIIHQGAAAASQHSSK